MNRLNRRIYRAVTLGFPGKGLPERVPELALLKQLLLSTKGTILDCGYAHAMPCHWKLLRNYATETLVGIDLAPRRPFKHSVYHWTVEGDLCKMPFCDDMVSLVVCISTLEHIGKTDPTYSPLQSNGTDVDAVREMLRVTQTGGTVFITVPYGKGEDFPTFRTYNKQSLAPIFAALHPHKFSVVYARHGSSGWNYVDESDLENAGYYDCRNAGASGVAMITARKMLP